MITRIVIIGGHIQALGLARQAHALGIEVVLYLTEPYSITKYSNSINQVIHGTTKTFLSDINRFALPENKTLLLPTNDEFITLLADHYDVLSTHFTLGIPDPQTIRLFEDKRNTSLFAQREGIPHPECFCPNSLDDLVSSAPTLHYPVVFKPAVMYTFHRIFGKKAFRCDTPEDLINIAKRVSTQYPINQIVVQEYLSGGPKHLFSYGVFAVDGEPKAWIIANRIRQNPMDFGNSTTYAITCNNREIESLACKIIKSTHYTGLAEVEFMYNDNKQRTELLEVNTRAWKWHTISEKHGFGFLDEMLRHYNNLPSCFTETEQTTAWVERLSDTIVSINEILHRRMSAKQWRNCFRPVKQYAVWSYKDPLPSIMYLLLSPLLYIKRH